MARLLLSMTASKKLRKKNPKAKGHIAACCKGNRKTAGGYIWKYIE